MIVTNSVDRLDRILLDRRIVTPEELSAAKAEVAASATNISLISFLVGQHKLDLAGANSVFAASRGWEYFPYTDSTVIPQDVLELIESSLARQYVVLPVESDGRIITVATNNPADLNLKSLIQGSTGLSVKLTYTPKDDLTRAVGKHYSTSQEAAAKGAEAAKAISSEALRRQIREIDDGGDMADIFDLILEGAMNSNASDIHLEPAKDFLSIRYEIDGKPHAQPNQQKHIAVRLASYIKSQAKLQPTDLQDQNGMFSKTIQGETRDIRVAVLPCQWGESITLRLASEKIMDLSRIGFSPLNEQLWRSQLSQPNGLILSVGPMGSGKTAMSMASLGEHMKTGRKIVTIENPVETRVPAGVTQVSINPGRNMTWGSVSGTVLRSAAKTIFFGEINHEDVAQAAVNMAMTGHIVISTLHTNTAPGAILRLRELGLRPSVLADTMRAVCAQRLPRTLCPHCKVAGPPPEAMIRDFQLDPSDLSDTEWFNSRPGGCRECYGIGYKGRSPIHELLIFDDELRELVIEDVPNSVLTRTAREHGMHTLKEDGVLMAKSGATSLEEIRQHIIL